MEMEMRDEMAVAMERLSAAAGLLEQVAERLTEQETALAIRAEASVERREAELERRLAEAEATIAELQARGAAAALPFAAGRKTTVPGTASLLGKQGEAVEAGALDAALVSLSLEQRIAVKAQLLRSGLV